MKTQFTITSKRKTITALQEYAIFISLILNTQKIRLEKYFQTIITQRTSTALIIIMKVIQESIAISAERTITITCKQKSMKVLVNIDFDLFFLSVSFKFDLKLQM